VKNKQTNQNFCVFCKNIIMTSTWRHYDVILMLLKAFLAIACVISIKNMSIYLILINCLFGLVNGGLLVILT